MREGKDIVYKYGALSPDYDYNVLTRIFEFHETYITYVPNSIVTGCSVLDVDINFKKLQRSEPIHIMINAVHFICRGGEESIGREIDAHHVSIFLQEMANN